MKAVAATGFVKGWPLLHRTIFYDSVVRRAIAIVMRVHDTHTHTHTGGLRFIYHHKMTIFIGKTD